MPRLVPVDNAPAPGKTLPAALAAVEVPFNAGAPCAVREDQSVVAVGLTPCSFTKLAVIPPPRSSFTVKMIRLGTMAPSPMPVVFKKLVPVAPIASLVAYATSALPLIETEDCAKAEVAAKAANATRVVALF